MVKRVKSSFTQTSDHEALIQTIIDDKYVTKVTRDGSITTLGERQDYIRHYLNTLMDINIGLKLEKMTGKAWDGQRTVTEVIEAGGPHNLFPNHSTVYRWLQTDWAQEIRDELALLVQSATTVETDLEWILILRNQRRIAITGNGRESTIAAQFVASTRKLLEKPPESRIGKIVNDLLSSGKFDGQVEVQERIRVHLNKAYEPPEGPVIDVTPTHIDDGEA